MRSLPLRAEKDVDIPLHAEAANYRDFGSPARYEESFTLLLEDLCSGRMPAALPERFHRTLVTAPPLPRKYLEILEALVGIRDAVPPGSTSRRSEGMGRIGKTVLARALCRDRRSSAPSAPPARSPPVVARRRWRRNCDPEPLWAPGRLGLIIDEF